VIARLTERQTRQGARFDARRDQPLNRRPISATALETGNELDAARRHVDREHPAQLPLQFLDKGLSNNLVIPERRDIPVVLSVALLHMTLFSVLVAAGVRFLPASKAIVLGYTTPLWVAIAAPLLGKDTLTAPKLAGALLGLIGLAVILNPTSIDWANANVVLGAGMVILAAISWAANIIYIRAHRWIASPLQLLIWQVLVATIVLTGSALVTDGLPHVEWSWRLALLFLYSGLIGTALAYWAMSMVNKSISALTTALGTTGTPLVGIAVPRSS